MTEESGLIATSDTESPSAAFREAKASCVAVITFSLIAANVLVFVAGVVAAPGWFLHPTSQLLLAWGANFGPLTAHGDWWRLITACFLHAGVIHVAMNMFILLQIGIFAEVLFGRARFLLIYLIAGVAGSLASAAAHPPIVSVGASGAVFGVYGAVLAFLLLQRHVVPTAQAWSIAKSAGIFIVYNLIYSMAKPDIDIRAHLGGLIGGFLAGAALARPLSSGAQAAYALRSVLVAICTVGVAWAVLGALSKNDTPRDALYRNLLGGKGVTVGKSDRVIFSGTATEQEAQRLGKGLVATGYFHDKGAAAMLNKGPDGTTITFITNEKDPSRPGDGTPARAEYGARLVPLPWDNPEFLVGVQNTGTIVAPTVGGPPVNIALLTNDGVLEKTIKVDTRIATIGTEDSVWYSDGATPSEAQELGKALQSIGFFRDQGMRVLLSHVKGEEDVSIVLPDEAWTDPRLLPVYQAIRRRLSLALGGKTFHLSLVNNRMERQKDL